MCKTMVSGQWYRVLGTVVYPTIQESVEYYKNIASTKTISTDRLKEVIMTIWANKVDDNQCPNVLRSEGSDQKQILSL